MNKEKSESLLEANRLIIEAEKTVDCSVLREDLNNELTSHRTNLDVLEAMDKAEIEYASDVDCEWPTD